MNPPKLNMIYGVRFVPADFATTLPFEVITDAEVVAAYKERLAAAQAAGVSFVDNQTFDPVLRPMLVRIELGYGQKP